MKMKNAKYRSRIFLFALVPTLLFLLIFAGCGADGSPDAQSGTEFFFDTAVTLTLYGEKDDSVLRECFQRCRELELVFSAENEESELYRLNHRTDDRMEVSDPLRDAILLGLRAGTLSDGLFDITVYPVTKCWDFRSGEGKAPDSAGLQAALKKVNGSLVRVDGNTVILDSPDLMIDLGAVAKGWISAELRRNLRERGVQGALIDLGGNISVYGKPGGKNFRIGIQEPFSERGVLEAVAELPEGCVISSGTYERFFYEDGKLYHHILSAKTGYPEESGLSQVTLIGTDDALLDTLSTVFMLTGREKAEEIIRQEGFGLQAVFTGTDGKMTLFEPETGEKTLRKGDTVRLKSETPDRSGRGGRWRRTERKDSASGKRTWCFS